MIHIFTVDPTTGKGAEQNPLALPSTTGGSGRVNSLPPVSGVGYRGAAGARGVTERAVPGRRVERGRLRRRRRPPHDVPEDRAGRRVPGGRRVRPPGARVRVERVQRDAVSDRSGQRARSRRRSPASAAGSGTSAAIRRGWSPTPTGRPSTWRSPNRDLVAVVDTSTGSVTHLIPSASAGPGHRADERRDLTRRHHALLLRRGRGRGGGDLADQRRRPPTLTACTCRLRRGRSPGTARRSARRCCARAPNGPAAGLREPRSGATNGACSLRWPAPAAVARSG